MFSTGTYEMAKKKAPKRMGRPPSAEGPRIQVLSFKGRQGYKTWLADFSWETREDMADLVEKGLALLAIQKGFRAPPER